MPDTGGLPWGCLLVKDTQEWEEAQRGHLGSSCSQCPSIIVLLKERSVEEAVEQGAAAAWPGRGLGNAGCEDGDGAQRRLDDGGEWRAPKGGTHSQQVLGVQGAARHSSEYRSQRQRLHAGGN